ncbi:MAG: hypothetical protein ACRC9K_15630 [Afipia sp.]
MVAEVFAGMGALKSAFDIAKALKEMDDAAKRNAAIINLQEIILDAQQAQFQLLSQISELKREVAEQKSKTDELARYELVDVRGDKKFAYRLKADAANGEPVHYACPVCFKNGKVAILHFRHRSEGQDYFDCHSCKTMLSFGEYAPSPSRSYNARTEYDPYI